MMSFGLKLMKYGVFLLSYSTQMEEPEIKWYVHEHLQQGACV